MNLGCRTGSRSKIFLKQNDGLHNQQTLFISKEKRSKFAQKRMAEVHAWYQPYFYFAFFSWSGNIGNKIIAPVK